MSAGNLWDLRAQFSHSRKDGSDLFDLRCGGGYEKGGSSPAGVITTNFPERMSVSIHRVASDGAVDVQVNETRPEIIPAQIDSVASCPARPQFRDLSISYQDIDIITDTVGQNYATIRENHWL